MSDNQTIKRVLTVEDKFSDELESFRNQLRDIGKQSDRTEDKIDDLNDELKDTAKGASKATPKVKGLSSAFGGATTAVKGFIGAYISMRGLEIAKDLSIASAEAKSVAESFDSMAQSVGYAGDELTEAMRKSTDNMIADVALQKNAMKALISGIDPEAMLVSMQYVSRYAQSVGGDAEQLMQTVMTGLARGSAQFLDDVGIQVMGSSDVVGDAVDQMKEKMLELNDNEFTGIRQFETTIENLKIDIGDKLMPILDLVIDTASEFGEAFDETEIEAFGETFENVAKGMLYTMGYTAEGVQTVVSLMNASINFSVANSLRLVGKMGEFVNTQVQSWKTVLSLVADPQWLEDLASNTAEFESLMTGATESADDNTMQSIENTMKRNEAIQQNIDKISTLFDEEEKITTALSNQTTVIEENTDAYERQKSILDVLYDSRLSAEQEYDEIWKQLEAERAEIEAQNIEDEKARIEARREMVATTISTAGDVASAFSSIHDSRMKELQREFDYEEDRINNSTMSRKNKEKALNELAKKRKKSEIEAAQRQMGYTSLIGASNLALALQKQILVILNTMADPTLIGGPAIRIGAGVAMAGATAGYVAQMKSAQAAIPKREYGGVARRNELYEVAERNKDEMFTSGGKNYFMPSSGGRVTPDVSGGSTNVTLNVSFGGGSDVQTIEERLPAMIAKGLEMADRNGEIQYGRMPNFQREVGA